MRTKLKSPPMLNKHLQSATEAFYSLRRNLFLNIMVILVISAVMTLPAIFWNLSQSIKTVSGGFENKISIYLKNNLSASDQKQILRDITALPQVKNVKFISPAEGMALLQKRDGMNDIKKFLPKNPLPAVIDVSPNITSKANYAVEMADLVGKLKSFSQVKEIFVNSSWLNQVYSMFKITAVMMKFLITTLLLAIFLIIGSTLSLIIQTRHEEINVLRLIGADDNYIQRVFLYTGMWYSLLGGILAILFTSFFLMALHKVLGPIALSYGLPIKLDSISVSQSYLLLLVAIFFGWLSAKIAVVRQIRLIEK
jgi:cell division transport system permease protein